MLGKKLKTLREIKNVKQKIVANNIGVSIQAYSHYERDFRVPDAEILKRLAKYYDVSIDYLLGLTEKSDFKNRLELIRKNKNLTQNELATILKLSQQAISAYEQGTREPDIITLKKLANYFNVSVDYLLGLNKNEISFKNILKSLRKDKELTQSELGIALGLTKQSISHYENSGSVPPHEVLIKIADYFNVSVDYLLGRTNIKVITTDNILGNRLRTLRTEKGLTQKQVADHFNMSDARYNQYETGKRQPDYETLQLFADYFNVSIDYLLGRIENKYIKFAIELQKEQISIDDIKAALQIIINTRKQLFREQKK